MAGDITSEVIVTEPQKPTAVGFIQVRVVSQPFTITLAGIVAGSIPGGNPFTVIVSLQVS